METLRAVPLGGLGRIGGNMMVYETERDLIVVDCGLLFPSTEQPGIDYVIPDMRYVLERRDKLRGYVITHAHEDHIGALAHAIEHAPAKIYGTRFTNKLIEVRLSEFPDVQGELEEMRDGVPFQLGHFRIEPLPMTHSVPGCVALAISTPLGVIVHTGDFKIDPTPLDGRVSDLERLATLGEQGVLALFSDSTGAEKPGWTWSEKLVGEKLAELIRDAPNRVVVTTFSSHIHRLQSVIDASWEAGRTVIPVGRSVTQNVQMSLENGFMSAPHGSMADPSYYENMPRSHVTVIASGSQGEPQSSMTRIAAGQHQHVRLDAGDRVIWSSRRIPGNEVAIGHVVNNLYRIGAEVIDDRVPHVHTSGHGFAGELSEMLRLVRPRYFVPVHGEYRHMMRHAWLAQETGVPAHRVFVTEDGKPIEFVRQHGEVVARRAEPVHAGHVFVDGSGGGDVGEVVLRDRRVLAETGIVMCVAIFSEDGELASGPDIVTRGVVHVDESQDLLERAKEEVRAALLQLGRRADTAQRSEEIRATVRRFFRRELDKRPLVLPVVMVL